MSGRRRRSGTTGGTGATIPPGTVPPGTTVPPPPLSPPPLGGGVAVATSLIMPVQKFQQLKGDGSMEETPLMWKGPGFGNFGAPEADSYARQTRFQMNYNSATQSASAHFGEEAQIFFVNAILTARDKFPSWNYTNIQTLWRDATHDTMIDIFTILFKEKVRTEEEILSNAVETISEMLNANMKRDKHEERFYRWRKGEEPVTQKQRLLKIVTDIGKRKKLTDVQIGKLNFGVEGKPIADNIIRKLRNSTGTWEKKVVQHVDAWFNDPANTGQPMTVLELQILIAREIEECDTAKSKADFYDTEAKTETGEPKRNYRDALASASAETATAHALRTNASHDKNPRRDSPFNATSGWNSDSSHASSKARSRSNSQASVKVKYADEGDDQARGRGRSRSRDKRDDRSKRSRSTSNDRRARAARDEFDQHDAVEEEERRKSSNRRQSQRFDRTTYMPKGGMDRPRCGHCGRPGHKPRDCYFKSSKHCHVNLQLDRDGFLIPWEQSEIFKQLQACDPPRDVLPFEQKIQSLGGGKYKLVSTTSGPKRPAWK